MASTYTLISSQVLASSAASVTFSSIPATYTDLVLRCSARSDGAVVDEEIKIVFNADTSTVYSFTYLAADVTTTPSSSRFATRAFAWALFVDGASATANTFGNLEAYIPNYLSTASKPFSSFGVSETNAATPIIAVTAALYQGSSGISSMALSPANGTNWVTNSSFYLYGISNA